MKILVVGVGNVGEALVRIWQAAGHEVLSTRRHSEANTPTTRELASSVDAVALCVPWSVAEEALASCGDLAGKILIDCTNPVTPSMDALSFGGTTSGAECLQAAQPGALVVKAFNSLGAGLLGNAAFGPQVADGFLCGEDAFAKEQVSQLVREAGLQPVDVGRLRNARYLEAMAMLWIDLAVHQHRKPAFAFKIISRKEEVQA